MTPVDILSLFFYVTGGFFFLAGTLGLLRLPDLLCRLHALTKADNLGLGLIILGLILQADSVWVACKLGLVWVLAMLAASTSCYAIAKAYRSSKINQDCEPPRGAEP